MTLKQEILLSIFLIYYFIFSYFWLFHHSHLQMLHSYLAIISRFCFSSDIPEYSSMVMTYFFLLSSFYNTKISSGEKLISCYILCLIGFVDYLFSNFQMVFIYITFFKQKSLILDFLGSQTICILHGLPLIAENAHHFVWGGGVCSQN